VDMYEQGEYVYSFLKEISLETDPNVSSDSHLVNDVLCHYVAYRRCGLVLLEFVR